MSFIHANNSTIDTNILNKTIKQKKIFDKIRDHAPINQNKLICNFIFENRLPVLKKQNRQR